jgi:acyl dehydratase
MAGGLAGRGTSLYKAWFAENERRGRYVQKDVVSRELLYHEDLEVGRPYLSAAQTVTAEDIIAFGCAYDPQPMHVDAEAAKATIVGGLCASGYHICVIMMRLVCDAVLNRVASLGSPGVDEVKWLKPLQPGASVHCSYRIEEKRVLKSRPDVGASKVLVELLDANDAVIATWVTNQFTRLRAPNHAARLSPSQRQDQRRVQAEAQREAKAPLNLWQGTPPGPLASKPDLFFEDREVGEIFDLGRHDFSKDSIIAFARSWDPQPFHLDEAAAKASLFGALAASGWHTAALYIRNLVAARQRASAAARAEGIALASYGPSPGFKNLSWPRPVLVGDTVEYRARLAAKIDLKSRPNRGLLILTSQGRNQKGEIVFGITSQILCERRQPYRAQ